MKTAFLLAITLLLLCPRISMSQVALTTTIGYAEGPIREITYNLDGTATVVVMNVTVHVPADLFIKSPTTTLTVRQLCLRNRLPGRLEAGFIGSTALIDGVVDVATQKFTATAVTVEPSENVLIGVITSLSPLRIQNTEVAILADPRITTQIINIYGFPVRLENLQVGQPAAAVGYYADNKLQSYVIELEPDAPLVQEVSQVNIQRAESRERTPNNNRGDEVDMRGFYYSEDGVQPLIQVFRNDNEVLTTLGFATLVPDAVHPKFGVWTFRAVTPPTINPILGTAPTKLRAVLIRANGVRVSTDIVPDLR